MTGGGWGSNYSGNIKILVSERKFTNMFTKIQNYCSAKFKLKVPARLHFTGFNYLIQDRATRFLTEDIKLA